METAHTHAGAHEESPRARAFYAQRETQGEHSLWFSDGVSPVTGKRRRPLVGSEEPHSLAGQEKEKMFDLPAHAFARTRARANSHGVLGLWQDPFAARDTPRAPVAEQEEEEELITIAGALQDPPRAGVKRPSGMNSEGMCAREEVESASELSLSLDLESDAPGVAVAMSGRPSSELAVNLKRQPHAEFCERYAAEMCTEVVSDSVVVRVGTK